MFTTDSSKRGFDQSFNQDFSNCGCSDRDYCEAHVRYIYERDGLKRRAEKIERMLLMRLALPPVYWYLPDKRETAEVLYDLAHAQVTVEVPGEVHPEPDFDDEFE